MSRKSHKRHHVRPLRVFVAPGTRAEKSIRSAATMPEPAVIAAGVPLTPDHDLVFHNGHIIADLVYTNFYVGGDGWQSSDMQSIDQALAAAMSDQNLNNVMVQYFLSGQITSTFHGSQVLAGPPPQTVSQGDVENMVRAQFDAGALSGFDLTSTLLNFLLPSGTILNTDTAPTGGAQSRAVRAAQESGRPAGLPTADEEDSTNGLGGYHGSVHVGSGNTAQIIYYAVGVFSEQLPDGTTNGIPVFDQSWKNVVATFYHELNEARTDADVEDAINAGTDPNAINFLGWTSNQGEECGDFPVSEAQPLTQVFQEVPLTDGSGTVPIQFQYSNADHGPGQPRDTPAPFAG
jgi:hypothetical protein